MSCRVCLCVCLVHFVTYKNIWGPMSGTALGSDADVDSGGRSCYGGGRQRLRTRIRHSSGGRDHGVTYRRIRPFYKGIFYNTMYICSTIYILCMYVFISVAKGQSKSIIWSVIKVFFCMYLFLNV